MGTEPVGFRSNISPSVLIFPARYWRLFVQNTVNMYTSTCVDGCGFYFKQRVKCLTSSWWVTETVPSRFLRDAPTSLSPWIGLPPQKKEKEKEKENFSISFTLNFKGKEIHYQLMQNFSSETLWKAVAKANEVMVRDKLAKNPETTGRFLKITI